MNIKIENLTKSYGKQKALNSVSLRISKGEIVGLLGPNGAGKSTLMKSITGAIEFDSGSIEVAGNNVTEKPIIAKQNIGFLAENNPLYSDLYVKEYLSFIAQLRKVKQNKISSIIELVGLKPEQHKKIHQLSKGYKQRVGLAQAIISNPEILILDEPTNGLDPNQIIEIRSLIQNIGKEKTVILSTHILQEVEAICNRVILLNKGNIIADEPIENFKGQFNNLEEAFIQLTNN